MFRFAKLASVLSIVPMLAFASPATALIKPYVEGGDIYRIKNITKNVDFADPATAAACDELLYKVRIHNPGPDQALTNVTAQAVFQTAASTTNISTMIIRADNASPSSTTDTATLNISSAQNLSYENGSTQLLDANSNPISTLPDTITQGGVSIGTVGVSIMEKRFVQFKMKVNCPPSTFTATATASATASATANASANCPKGSTSSVATATATASASASATASATSSVSQADADQKANTEAKSKAQSEAQAKANAQANASANAAASAKCTPETVVTVTTKTPPALPNTGAGSVAGIFAGVSAAAGFGHYLWRRRAA